MFVAALCAVLSKAHLSPGLVGFSVSAALQVLQTPPNLGSRLWVEWTQTPAMGTFKDLSPAYQPLRKTRLCQSLGWTSGKTLLPSWSLSVLLRKMGSNPFLLDVVKIH